MCSVFSARSVYLEVLLNNDFLTSTYVYPLPDSAKALAYKLRLP